MSARRQVLLSTVPTLAVLFFLLSPLASVGSAQFITSSMSGAVHDASAAAIPEAAVTLTHVATGRQRTTVTGSDGTFVFTALEAGEYFLTVVKEGFTTAERKGLVVETGQRYPVGLIVLEVGALSEVTSVSANSAVVETQSGERSLSISTSQIENLTNLGRDFKTLVQLVPGIVNFSNPDDPGARVSFNALGMRNTTNNITIDGTPITSTDYPAEHFAHVSQDSIEEVKILTSNYQAEYGRLSGANVEVVTKSGTREFHGLGSYFTRHEQFNATNFFDNREGREKPRYRYNTWTYNVGGPIYIPGKFNTDRSKLFFFFGQEYWPREGVSIDQVKVPTERERQGDFSQSFDLDGNLITVRDPVTQQPYAGNRIPQNQLDPSGVALLNAFPVPNFFDDNISGGNYNFVSEFPTRNHTRYENLKIDYNLNSNNFLTVSYTGATGSSTSPGRANWPQLPTNGSSRDQTASVRYTRVFSPTVLNEFHVGLTRSDYDTTSPADALARNQRDTAGFTAGSLFPEGKPLNLLPWAEFEGVAGTPATLEYLDRHPFEASFQTILISDRVSIVRGSHNLKFGISLERNSREMGTQGGSPFGSFDFGTNPNNPLDTGYAYANAAVGVFNSYTESSARPWTVALSGITEGFAQDTWRVTSRLTLDLGARISYFVPMYDKNDLLSGFQPWMYDPANAVQLIQPGLDSNGTRVGINPVDGTEYPEAAIGAIAEGSGDPFNGLVVAGQGDVPRALTSTQGFRVAPRVGFAYDVFGTGTTAIRGGFGVFFNRDSMDSTYKPFSGLPPHVVTPTIQYGTLATLRSSSTVLFPNRVGARELDEAVPHALNFSLAVQQDIGFSTVLDVAYVGALGRNLYWRRNINPVPAGANFQPENIDPTTNTALPTAFLRPTIGYGDILMVEPAGSSNYHSLQVSARRRLSDGLEFGLAWTYSKAMDYVDNDTQGPNPLIPVREWDYGVAGFDRTHVLKVNFVYELPELTSGHRLVRGALNGWQASGIYTFQSGAPMTVTWSRTSAIDITGTPSLNARVDVIDDPTLPADERTFGRAFRTDAFRLPEVGTFGNAGRWLFRGPGVNNWDLSVMKNFRLVGRVRSQFRIEMYNALNHTQFTDIDTAARFSTAGEQVNTQFGQYSEAASARIIQLALRFMF